MRRTGIWVGLLVAVVLVAGQISFAQAAPLQQSSTVTINSITEITDPGGNVTGYIQTGPSITQWSSR
jgi:hypothetical protein